MRLEINEQPWVDDAACRGHAKKTGSYDIFFSEDVNLQKEAMKICQACGVRLKCLDYAIDHVIIYGVWGGLTEKQRQRIRRRRYRENRKAAKLSEETEREISLQMKTI